MPLKQAVALRHVHFEDLGNFEPPISDAGYAVRYIEAVSGDFASAAAADLLVVLGGPISVYEQKSFPFLAAELALLRERLARGAPTLGICLGAQLIAHALGAPVYAAGFKEIGWGGLALTDAGRAGPLRHIEGLDVLHWHGDTFELPAGCDLLASTDRCRNQAFARGANLLALQFHPEVDAAALEHWLVGHSAELAAAKIAPTLLRDQARESAPPLVPAGQTLLAEWLGDLI